MGNAFPNNTINTPYALRSYHIYIYISYLYISIYEYLPISIHNVSVLYLYQHIFIYFPINIPLQWVHTCGPCVIFQQSTNILPQHPPLLQKRATDGLYHEHNLSQWSPSHRIGSRYPYRWNRNVWMTAADTTHKDVPVDSGGNQSESLHNFLCSFELQ